MIITGGTQKGRKIKVPKIKEVRPTSSKVRQSIFNIIFSILGANNLAGKNFLDLFAGSGIMGIEALSRGAKKTVFVENNFQVSKCLRENLSAFDFDYELVYLDVIQALDKFEGSFFDIIFADPPYRMDIIDLILKKIKENNILNNDGIAIIEHRSDLILYETANDLNFNILKTKIYGSTAITILNYKN